MRIRHPKKTGLCGGLNERGMAICPKNQKKLAEKAIQDFEMAIKLKPDYVSRI